MAYVVTCLADIDERKPGEDERVLATRSIFRYDGDAARYAKTLAEGRKAEVWPLETYLIREGWRVR